jgi:hypothetical protein
MGEFRISSDPTDNTRLRLHGAVSRAAVGAIKKAASEVLATSRRGVVLELDGVSGIGRDFALVVNEIARGAVEGQTVTLEVPVDALDLLDRASLHTAVHIEPTAPPVGPAAKRPTPTVVSRPTPGAPRREGAGFVTSYGSGRACATPGCSTTLSRYNDSDRCTLHRGGFR